MTGQKQGLYRICAHGGRRYLVRFEHVLEYYKESSMSDHQKVWPTGLTEAESEEIHRQLIQGTQIFGMIAALAHLLAYIYSPWLK
jgi:light-harvesting protein B-800-850 beta chain